MAAVLFLSSPLSILYSRAAPLPGSSQSLASDPPKGRVKQWRIAHTKMDRRTVIGVT